MKKNYREYKELDRKIDKLFGEEKYKEAVKKLEESYDSFPEYDFELKVYALYCCREMKDYDKCLTLLNEGLSKGYFYGLKWGGWDPMKQLPGWKEIEEQNQKNRAIAGENSKMEYKVYTPEQYDADREYPLFITLHGDGTACNIEEFSDEWKPDTLLKKGFIVAYVQSSHPECTGGFGWTSDYGNSRKEITEAYDSILEKYSVDKNTVLVGGFSGGSMASLNLMMNDSFPIKGIVALCPNKTDDCTDENMKKAAERGTSMVLLEGEKSGEQPFHLELMEWAEKNNLRSEYVINKNTGHNVPEGFGVILNKAVDFLLD